MNVSVDLRSAVLHHLCFVCSIFLIQRPATGCSHEVLCGLLTCDARERGLITQPRLHVNSWLIDVNDVDLRSAVLHRLLFFVTFF